MPPTPPATILPDPSCLKLLALSADSSSITVTVTTTATRASCPVCQRSSTHVHSRSTRQLTDLPWQGIPVRLVLHVRKFFCHTPSCERQIFTERVPGVVAAYGRRTQRLETWLTTIGFALGGEAGARLLRALGLGLSALSADRLLMRIRRFPVAAPQPVRVLSVDDFALQRSRRYATLLVDLERRAPIDVLPDRSADTFAQWLHQQPWAERIEVISRDRGGDYAEGARRGAPQAIQVADRFHLVKNVGEAAERVLKRHVAELQCIAVPARAARSTEAGASRPSPAGPPTSPPRRYREASKARSHAKRTERYEAIQALARQGLTRRAIARALGLNRKTVQSYLAADTAPQRPRQVRTASILRPYESYLLERWGSGVHNGLQLWREIVALGYPGTRGNVSRWVAFRRRCERDGVSLPATPPAPGLQPRQAAGLLLIPAAERTPDQERAWHQMRQSDSEVERALTLLERVLALIRAHSSDGLDAWLDQAAGSGVPELEAFVTKLRQDEEAVRAGLSLSWSQGQMEGQVNRVKLIKRSMYGRGKLDLLRQRVLYRAAA
ncbi:MAG TPA: ISL3 family transposase [Ktedonobacterales bacterium]|nr:ISL3 family transposase [Ktedonobacterales bacterium]